MDRLVGHANFQRFNPHSDLFPVRDFHHLEFWCPDAVSASRRFQFSLGMTLVARSDLSTGNKRFSSYVLKSQDLLLVFTTPSPDFVAESQESQLGFDADACREFIAEKGLAVRAVAISVEDAAAAFETAVANGATAATSPRAGANDSQQVVAEVELYGRTVLRFVSGSFSMDFMAEGYEAVYGSSEMSYGLKRMDHVVGNVPDLLKAVNYVMRFSGFHEFAEFTAEDVGTLDSGLNSVVLASNKENVLLPINEPTMGTRRQSQIQTYLDHNRGAGVQHVAISTDDIFETLTQLRKASEWGGFELMERPSAEYYAKLPGRIGDSLTKQQYEDVERLGLLVDKDDQGLLLQIFTKPITERPTFFFEFIQRMGCEEVVQMGTGAEKVVQKGGCGGFGKGNFSELFKSIEEYEKTIGI